MLNMFVGECLVAEICPPATLCGLLVSQTTADSTGDRAFSTRIARMKCNLSGWTEGRTGAMRSQNGGQRVLSILIWRIHPDIIELWYIQDKVKGRVYRARAAGGGKGEGAVNFPAGLVWWGWMQTQTIYVHVSRCPQKTWPCKVGIHNKIRCKISKFEIWVLCEECYWSRASLQQSFNLIYFLSFTDIFIMWVIMHCSLHICKWGLIMQIYSNGICDIFPRHNEMYKGRKVIITKWPVSLFFTAIIFRNQYPFMTFQSAFPTPPLM